MTPDLDRLEADGTRVTSQAWEARFEHMPIDPTAQTEPLTIGQGIVAAYETHPGPEPCELAAAIDAAIHTTRLAALEQVGVTDEDAALREALGWIAGWYPPGKPEPSGSYEGNRAIWLMAERARAALASAPIAPTPGHYDMLAELTTHSPDGTVQRDNALGANRAAPIAQAGETAESWQGYSNPEDSAAMFMDWCALHGFGLAGWPPGAHKQLCAHLAAAERKSAEAAISVIKGGSFLHDDAPAARFAQDVVAAIRRELALQPPAGTP